MAIRILKFLSYLLGLSPLVYSITAIATGNTSGNLIESLTKTTGWWALFFVLLTLTAKPLSERLSLIELIRLRRQWGQWTMFYVFIHLSIYLILDFELIWIDIYYDIIENYYIIFGLFATNLLILLSLTSIDRIQRKYRKRWKQLHNFIYVIVFLATIHVFLLTKSDYTFIIVYSICYAVLLANKIFTTFIEPRLDKSL